MRKNVYQKKYWYNYFNCVNSSINKIFHYIELHVHIY